MKKKKRFLFGHILFNFLQPKFIMKLFVCMLVFTVVTVNTNVYSQTKHISINVKSVSIVNLFEEITRQSGYSFFFNEEKVVGLNDITIKKDNVSVEELLDEVFRNTSFEYKIKGNAVVVKELEEKKVKKQHQIDVKGTVKDATSGESLVGVNIAVKASVLGTVTDVNGHFWMRLPSYATALSFSFIGYKTQEIPISGKMQLDVELVPDVEGVGEVVVTGYQVINKRELTSSIATVKAKDLELLGALTVDQMLEGKATGLLISSISSTPGAASKVRVRSGGTFTGSREPLWVVDGVVYESPVPLSANEINSFDRVNLIGNALTGINPQDIESINVLKDASATAIYGTKASNGVIVITTKRGRKGNMTTSYTGSVSYVDRPYYSNLNLMNSKERVDVSREIMEKYLPYPEDIFSYLGYEGALRDYKLGRISFGDFQEKVSQAETLNTDWFKELYRPALNTTHNISFSGGTDKIRYYHSVGYNYNQGTERSVGLNRVTARSNLDLDLSKKVLVSIGISGSVQEANYNHYSVNLFDEAYYNSRAIPFRNADGSLFFIDKKINEYQNTPISARYNILNEIDNSDRNISNREFNINGQLRYNIVKGIKLRGKASYRSTTNIDEEWIADNTFFIANLRTYDAFEDKVDELVNARGEVAFGGIYSGGQTSQTSYMGQLQLNFTKVIATKHVFNFNLGYEVNSIVYKGATGWKVPGYNHDQGRSFIKLPRISTDPTTDQVDNFEYTNMINWMTQKGKDIYPSVVDRTANSLSSFLIFSYSFDNRYVFNFNMRSDGSNSFGQYERYKFKPTWSVSGRWNIHKEHFMNIAGLEELALRGSYGFRGTPPSKTPYMIISHYQYQPSFKENLANLNSFPNSNLTWEKTSTLNLGLNYSWFKGRLSGALDFAYSKGTDLLLSRPVSLVNGEKTQQYNAGSKNDYSYEMSLRGVLLKRKKMGWSISANMTMLKEKVLAGYEAEDTALNVNDYLNGSIYLTGFPVDAFYSYQFESLDKRGLPQFKNLDYQTESISKYFQKVLSYSGRRSPKVYGGFSSEFKLSNFSLRANFSYKLGYNIRRLNLYSGSQNMPMPYENMSSEFNNRWKNSGDEKFRVIPGLSDEKLLVGRNSNINVTHDAIVPVGNKNGWFMYDKSDQRVVDGSHIRFRSLTLGYQLPKKILSSLKVSSCRLNFQVSNIGVWVFDDKLKGQDPEQVNREGLPSLPTYSLNINIGI